MRRRCLGLGCPRLIMRGSYCQQCKLGTGWGKGRNRQAQAKFRAAVMARDGGQCTYRDPRTGERCTTTHDLRACHIVALAQGGGYELSNGRLLCKAHDRLLDPTPGRKSGR